MDTSKDMLISNKGDITSEVAICRWNQRTRKYGVTFKNGKTFSYNYESIEWLKDPEVLDANRVQIKHGGRELFGVAAVYIFRLSSASYWRVRFEDRSERTYHQRDLEVTYSCLSEKGSQDCMRYLRELSALNELTSEDGIGLLQKQYDKLGFVGRDTAMAVYLNPQVHRPTVRQECEIIFPFGGNTSQFEAVKNALLNQVSVIQGPPGTGKTQTILNIIANVLIQGKTVQVVSNNNSAIANVLEKLSSPKYGLGFAVAQLGSSDNKAEFIRGQTGEYPEMSSWQVDRERQSRLLKDIALAAEVLWDVFAKQERLALARQELESLKLEMKYFEGYCVETGILVDGTKLRRSLKPAKLLRLWQECVDFAEQERAPSFWFKVKSVFIYGVSNWDFYKNQLPTIVTLLQSLFYKAKRSELEDEIASLTRALEKTQADQRIDDLTLCSMEYLRAKLFEKYGARSQRTLFAPDDLWQRPDDITREYPVTLSTTFSSRSSLGKNAVYDYVIMDEASQVDIVTGALALSCARNIVIVGDLKQLPNVVTDAVKKQADAIFASYNLPEGYRYSGNSFLKSICTVLPDVPQTLLREHYRCHPKIIGFCNQKFYNNELIIMTEDRGEKDALSVHRTVVGNHRRDKFNQRHIDVIRQEVLPSLQQQGATDDIGIIAPYNAQVDALKMQLDSYNIEVSTVHKYQGREKGTIILTPVDDVVTKFSDDPYLLNVAISRAKNRLCLIVSGNEQPDESNIRDLISYIEYNNFAVVQSEVYSVFDFLYQQYTAERVAFLRERKRVSRFDSENLMYATIVDVLAQHPNLSLSVICHQPLNMLIRDPRHLNDEECRYAMNTATHVDFLVYNRVSKKPAFVVEVDGYHYHKEGTKQKQRDKVKDRILSLYNIPLLRLSTTGSDEKEKLHNMVLTHATAKAGVPDSQCLS